MYEDNEKTVDWKSIIKKVVIVVVVIVAILGLFTLVKSCTRKDDKTKEPTPTNVDLTKQLDELEDAVLKYLTVDNLPTTVNSSKTIRLKILTNREIISGIKDDAGNTCDTSSSYAEVTKLDNNYAVKLSLTCGPNNDYRIIYVGCFENCNGSICKGEETSTNGICEIAPTENPTDDNKNGASNNTTNSNNTNTSNNSTTNKPNTNTNTQKPNNNSNANNNNNNNNSSNNNNNTNTVKTVIEYEYRKARQEKVCVIGDLINGQCAIQETAIIQGKLKKSTTTKILGDATPKTSAGGSTPAKFERTITVEPASLSKYKNSNTVGYINKGISASTGKVTLAKYTCSTGTIKLEGSTYKCQNQSKTTYSCSVGEPRNINGVYKCVKDEETIGCEDPHYTYNKDNNTCTIKIPVTNYKGPITATYYDTTWSRSTSLNGWTRTGNTRTVRE